ncbi:SEN1 N terminal-domain-containing protein [Crucibulum laeve]|uniref:SEN1 N terminal-domain-containing protein n=1 Tax=Crucibulum laeve TaxID=68775 RepID=A0A5C3M5Q3_9AGAR|nr:SEN1 N terminal-domain-containing protein [Crucibulum laeve]
MSSSEKTTVKKLLATLHDNPVDNSGASDDVLGSVFSYLIAVPPTPSGDLHWFCHEADPTTVAAATFLLRLFAYNSAQVNSWKEKLHLCLSRCVLCVQGLQEVKVTSKDTFFGAFDPVILERFYDMFEEWELVMLLEDLKSAGFHVLHAASNKASLSDAPAVLLYRMLSNWKIIQDGRIHVLLQKYPPSGYVTGWPKDLLPAGLFILMLDVNNNLRTWARNYASKCTVVPLPYNTFVGPYPKMLEKIVDSMASPDSNIHSVLVGGESLLVEDPPQFWSGFYAILRLVPVEFLKASTLRTVNLCRIVNGHLHDNGPQFEEILRCLHLLLKRLGDDFWAKETPEYSQIVFDAVKDNPSFLDLLRNISPGGQRPWFLAWFPEYLHTISKLGTYGDILAKMADFLCEEMQHERFREAQPMIMDTAARLLSSVFKKAQSEETFVHKDAILHVLDIHAPIFIGVAYSRDYDGDQLGIARASARSLVITALQTDIQDISLVITKMCALLARPNRKDIPLLTIRKQMWMTLYATLQSPDMDGLTALICITAKSAHLDSLRKRTFKDMLGIKQPGEGYSSGEQVLERVNESLAITRDVFPKVISKFVDYHSPTSGIELLRRPGVAKAVTILMLAPVQDLSTAAQALVGLAFDVDGRSECFQALLKNLPDGALEGILDFLLTFSSFAPAMPEACSVSKSLVRCLTDVLEVLCASPTGLLHNSRFLRATDDNGPASQLQNLWDLMTKSLAVIFKRTPSWATYFDNEEMIVWMRDALIFGRDLLAQWRVVENAANTHRPTSTGAKGSKLSKVGASMVNSLQSVLFELVRWLRLTDEELLHQSFSLLESLLGHFRDIDIPPSTAVLEKLTKYVDDARKDSKQAKSRLDSSRILRLEDALSTFIKEEDEIQIISHTFALKPETKAPKTRLAPEVAKKPTTVQQRKRDLEVPTRAGSSSSSKFFSDRDQEILDEETALPSFRRTSKATGILPKVPFTVDKDKRVRTEPKNEAIRPSKLSEKSDSESASESSGEEQGGGLAALAKLTKSPKIKKAEPRRQIKTLDVPMERNPVQERLKRREEVRRTALRLKPDVSGLHRVLLSWNYDHSGPTPPGNSLQLVTVPDKFRDYQHYHDIFQPLLFLECWSQILQSKDEKPEIYECEISSRQYCSDWLDIDVSLSGNVRKEWYLAETDIVLLRHPTNQKSILAKTQNYKSVKQSIQATFRCFIQEGSSDPGLHIGTTWKISKIFSLSTLHREYGALMSLPYYDLCNTILRPDIPKVSKIDSKELQQVMSIYRVNEPQAVAILNCLQTEGFALVQGPPGTGKTSTICGLVGRFMSKRTRPSVPIQVGRTATTVDKPPVAKILVCAPSNAAIDELAHRLKEVCCGSGRQTALKVVRIGTEQSMNLSVKDISLDSLVDQRLNANGTLVKTDYDSEFNAKLAELMANKQLAETKKAELAAVRDNIARHNALEAELAQLTAQRRALNLRLDFLRDKKTSEHRTLDALRRSTRKEILREADVICSTLSGAGHDVLEDLEFEMVIIDEAAQAIELSSLIPLKYRCTRCIMVGDPQQLPPTVLSQEACRYRYNQSLFVRLQRSRPDVVHLLSIQYRMHPDISSLPSRVFYNGRLTDGPGMADKTQQPWHDHVKFGTYKFFNVPRGLEEQSGRSIKNTAECQIAVSLYGRLRQEFSVIDFDTRVGVVSMYRAQIVELRRCFEERFGKEIVRGIDFNTVDGFQGQEKDIIILSCVRAGPGLQSVGFLSDVRRMNVALTRAKSSLFIIGNAPTLERSDNTWREIVLDARTRSSLTDVDSTYFTTASSASATIVSRKTKLSTSVTTTLPAVPMNLVTPRELKAAVDRNQPMVTPTSPVGQTEVALHASSPTATLDTSSNTLPRGLKRPAEFEPSTLQATGTSSVSGEVNQKPKPPLAKRVKAPPSLFIPSKAKRPPAGQANGRIP